MNHDTTLKITLALAGAAAGLPLLWGLFNRRFEPGRADRFWSRLLTLSADRPVLLPACYASSVVAALFAVEAFDAWLVGPTTPRPWIHFWKEALFATVTGGILLGLFSILARTATRNRALLEGSRDLMILATPSGRIVDANESALRAYGWSRDEMLRLNINAICGGSTAASCAAQEVMARGGSVVKETQHLRKDGRLFPVEVCATLGRLGREGSVLLVSRDISERKRKEAMDRLLHDIDRGILQGIPLDRILAFVSSRLAEIHPSTLIQLSLKDPDGSVRIVKSAGSGLEFLDGISVRWDDTESGRGPTGTAIRTGHPQFRRLEEDQGFLPWRDKALGLGFREAVAIPLASRGETLGALTMLGQSGSIDPGTIEALKGFADQVAISVLSSQFVTKLDLQRVAMESAANAIVVTDVRGSIQWVNPAFSELTGYSAPEVYGRSPRLLKSGNHGDGFYRQMWETILSGKTWRGELYNRRKDGSLYLEEQTITPVRDDDGSITHFVAIKSDITTRRQQEERIQHLAMHDPLTELPNRRLLSETLARAAHQARRGRSAAFMLIDIDDFKVVNDSLGHAAGDQLLRQLADLITHALRPGDFVARFGGDEFAAILEDSPLDDARAAAERVKHSLDLYRFTYGSHKLAVSASIGVVGLDADTEAESVLVQADSALYQAKELGKNRVVVYHEGSDWSTRMAEAGRLATLVKEALHEGGFELVFQPVIDLTTGATEHYEALLRLRDASGSLLLPDMFLRAAERFGLMPQIDRWVATHVVEILAERRDLRVFVNLSGPSLADEALLEHVEHLIREHGIQPGHLAFEITEATAITDISTAQRWISRLKGLGCMFALDDFGVGFSSLSYLRSLPVDYVKIDRSFVSDIHKDATSLALVAAVKTVAHTLGKEVIAEGVECEADAYALKSLGIEWGQGFHWGRPSGMIRPGTANLSTLGLRPGARGCDRDSASPSGARA